MQLFSLGLYKLSADGRAIADANGEFLPTYDNTNIMNFARAWTGFTRRGYRGNLEAVAGEVSDNFIDPMELRPEWRDVFPKVDLGSGFLGDSYALCANLPARMFLRRGASFQYLGYHPVPQLQPEAPPSAAVSSLELDPATSALHSALCARPSNDGAQCNFPSEVVLDRHLLCDGVECQVDTARVVSVYDSIANRTVFYEYVRMPCVQLSLHEDPVMVRDGWKRSCVNPELAGGGAVCCTEANKQPAGMCVVAGERLTRDTAAARCAGAGLTLCDSSISSNDYGCGYNAVYSWTASACKTTLQVDAQDGWVSLVHAQDGQDATTWSALKHLRPNSKNLFPVPWESGGYPTPSNGCSSGTIDGGAPPCVVLADSSGGSCLCDVMVETRVPFTENATIPSRVEVQAQLKIGSASPHDFDDGLYVQCQTQACLAAVADGVSVYTRAGGAFDALTIFGLEPVHAGGARTYLANQRSMVTIGSFGFRNPPRFMDLLEPTVRDAAYETEALLDHLFFHENAAPFVSHRLIQRLTTSNPSPRYVGAVADAFRSGSFRGATYAGTYGDLAATVVAILLDPEARSSTLDIDSTHGQLREPILKVLHLMRSLQYVPKDGREVELINMLDQIGQEAYNSPTGRQPGSPV